MNFFSQRCLSFTTVWFETIQLRWNTTNSKFRAFCLLCLPILCAQKMIEQFCEQNPSLVQGHICLRLPHFWKCPVLQAVCLQMCNNWNHQHVYPYIVLMAGITLVKFGGLCTDFSLGRNDISHRWVVWFSTKKNVQVTWAFCSNIPLAKN